LCRGSSVLSDCGAADQALNTTSSPQTITVTNTGTAAASVAAIAVSGDFAETTNCATIAVGGSCTVSVTFTPTAAGSRTGSLTITSNASKSPTTVGLTGTGAGSVNLALNQPT
jgi:hypothetical protein